MAEILSYLVAAIGVKVLDPLWWFFVPLAALLSWRRKWFALAAVTAAAILLNAGMLWDSWKEVPRFAYAWHIGAIGVGYAAWAILISAASMGFRRLSRAASSP